MGCLEWETRKCLTTKEVRQLSSAVYFQTVSQMNQPQKCSKRGIKQHNVSGQVVIKVTKPVDDNGMDDKTSMHECFVGNIILNSGC